MESISSKTRILPFRCVSPLLYYQYLWVGESDKSPWYLCGWRLWILQNFEFPHPFPSNSKQRREFSPAQGQRSQFMPLYSPTYSPGWPGVLPQGQADDMCINRRQVKGRLHHGSNECGRSFQTAGYFSGSNFGILPLNCMVGLGSMFRQCWVFFFAKSDCFLLLL